VSHLQAEQAEALLVICFEVLAQGSACLKAGLRFTQGTSYLSHGLQLPVQGLPTKRCWLDEGMLAPARIMPETLCIWQQLHEAGQRVPPANDEHLQGSR